MRFVVDENISPKTAKFLKDLGYTAVHVREIKLGLEDDKILKLSVVKDSIVLTSDKDFGELVFKKKHPHVGVVLLRLKDETLGNTIRALDWLIKEHPTRLRNRFAVVREKDDYFRVKFEKMSSSRISKKGSPLKASKTK